MIDRRDIEALFADLLDQMTDASLRDAVVSCWVDGCREGNWESVDQLRQMPFTLLTDTHGIDFLQHTLAVTEGAVGLALAQVARCPDLPYAVNLDYVIAGGLLHDVGKLLEIERDGGGGYRKSYAGHCARHPISGAIIAARNGVPQEVVNIIACHSKEGAGRPKRVETVLVHQADFGTFDPLILLNKGDLIGEGSG
jgi:putative nucleotidyltransferase with HDIG domain